MSVLRLALMAAAATVVGEVFLQHGTYFDAGAFNSTASVSLTAAGQVEGVGDTTPADYAWLVEGSAADFEVYATLNSGGLTGGTTGQWLSLDQTRTWSVTAVGAGSDQNATITLKIRAKGTTTDLATGQMTLGAANA